MHRTVFPITATFGTTTAPSPRTRRRRPHNTAATQLVSNQKTLQEEIPEGDTHIHLSDVSCKSLVVNTGGLKPNTWQRLERLGSAWK